MRRREFIPLLGSAALAPAMLWPLAALAQQPAMPVIGFLNSGSPALFSARVAAFLQGLNDTGFVEGRNVMIEYQWAQGQYDRLPALAADLVRRRVAVIAATGGIPSALAAKGATSTIPIVFVAGSDPIKFGVVTSLSRPDGNVTGLTAFTSELVPKRLELLHEVIKEAATIALLVNPTNAVSESVQKDVQEAARALGLQLNVVHANAEPDLQGLRNLEPTASGRARGRYRYVLRRPKRTTRRIGPAPCHANHLPNPRVRSGRRFDELWR
jgi:putative ABC transport system substrate-binding protein